MDMRKVAREVRLSKWSGIMQEQKASGMSIHAWCAANGVNKQRYFYWQRQLRESACESLVSVQGQIQGKPPSFVEMTPPEETSCTGTITVRIGGAVIEIAGDATPSAIESVIRVLRER